MTKEQVATLVQQTAARVYNIGNTEYSKHALPKIVAELNQLLAQVDTVDVGETAAPSDAPAT